MERMALTVEDMHCGGCAERIRMVLEREPGVRQVSVELETRRAEVAFNPGTVGRDRLKAIVEAAGFQVRGADQ